MPDRIDWQTNWECLLNSELAHREKMFSEFVEGKTPSPDDLRTWWGLVEQVLFEFSKGVGYGFSPTPPPANLALALSKFAASLAVGTIPEPIKDAVKEGNPSAGPFERRDLQIAVAYLRAATTGLPHNGYIIKIDDIHPNKTICKSYGAKPSTVRGWAAKYSPAFLGVNDVDSELLLHMMQTAGERVQQEGRSQKAIQKRNAKARVTHN